jgi:hypothetical protein
MLCPANLLGYLHATRPARTGHVPSWGVPVNASSFRAECPAPLHLREAPGHAAEESLFDVTGASICHLAFPD